jgi:hypothetical protein
VRTPVADLLAWSLLWSLAVLGADRVLRWAGVALERALRWRKIRKDIAATVRRIERRG